MIKFSRAGNDVVIPVLTPINVINLLDSEVTAEGTTQGGEEYISDIFSEATIVEILAISDVYVKIGIFDSVANGDDIFLPEGSYRQYRIPQNNRISVFSGSLQIVVLG